MSWVACCTASYRSVIFLPLLNSSLKYFSSSTLCWQPYLSSRQRQPWTGYSSCVVPATMFVILPACTRRNVGQLEDWHSPAPCSWRKHFPWQPSWHPLGSSLGLISLEINKIYGRGINLNRFIHSVLIAADMSYNLNDILKEAVSSPTHQQNFFALACGLAREAVPNP